MSIKVIKWSVTQRNVQKNLIHELNKTLTKTTRTINNKKLNEIQYQTVKILFK